MEKKIKLRSKWLIPFLILTAAATAIGVFVIAKYSGTADVSSEANLQWFDVAPVIVGAEGTDYESWDADTGVVEMTPAQYQNFALNVQKTGEGWAYIRVSVEDSWRSVDADHGTETVIPVTGNSVNWDSSIVMNTDSSDIHGYVNGIATDPGTIAIIDGPTNPNTLPTGISSSDTNYVVQLSIKVEAIQYNRLDAFWGLTGDPF